MGSRHRRLLAAGAIVVCVVGAITAGVLVMRMHSHSKSHNGDARGEVFGTFGAFRIADGVRGNQLLKRFGPPDQKRNGCWIYRIRGGTFQGIKLIPQIAGIDAVRYCFYSGVVAIIEDHWRPGTYNPQIGPWEAPVTYGCGGGPCQRLAP